MAHQDVTWTCTQVEALKDGPTEYVLATFKPNVDGAPEGSLVKLGFKDVGIDGLVFDVGAVYVIDVHRHCDQGDGGTDDGVTPCSSYLCPEGA